MQVNGQGNVYAEVYPEDYATPQPVVIAEGTALPVATPASEPSWVVIPISEPVPAALAGPPQQTPAQTPIGGVSSPAASTLPTTGEPAPAAPPAGTAGQQATEQALGAASPGKLVSTLSKMRKNGDTAALEAFAVSFAANYGIPLDDARRLTDAMSRGLTDSKALAEGIDALRNMSAAERAGWLVHWLPAARGAAWAIQVMDGNKTMKMFGATPDIANAIGNFALMNVRLVDRNKKLSPKQTLEERAQAARDTALKRVSKDAGARALMAEASKAGTDVEARAYLTATLTSMFQIPTELADRLIVSMRSQSQVGKLTAEALQLLEDLGPTSGFAQGFFYTAQQALAAEAAIAADPFKSALGPMGAKDVQAIATLADFVDTLKKYSLSLAKQKVEPAKAA